MIGDRVWLRAIDLCFNLAVLNRYRVGKRHCRVQISGRETALPCPNIGTVVYPI
ncbi:hypothetical protein [Microcoleus sp. SVA1_A4]